MAKRNGNGSRNGKAKDPQLGVLTSIEAKIADLVEGQERLVEGQKLLVEGQLKLIESVSILATRMDHMLTFLGEHWSDHDRRLALLEQRLAKAGI